MEPVTLGQVLQSPLVTRWGGFATYSGLLNATQFAMLQQEAKDAYSTARPQEWWGPDREDDYDRRLTTDRRADPRRMLLLGDGGPVQSTNYLSAQLSQFLSRECRMIIRPTSTRGSFSYYTRPGDFLGLHRDVETCDISVITVLHDESSSMSRGGALVLYPGRITDALSAIRARPYVGAQTIKLSLGQTLVMFGGVIAHRVLPVVQGQRRVVSVLCFRAFFQQSNRSKHKRLDGLS